MNNVFIIAEAGVNHNGDIQTAKRLIDVAMDAGADAVKFQTFRSEKLVSKNAGKAEYQKQTTSASESQLEMLRKMELGRDAHFELHSYCKTRGIDFLSTPFDFPSIELLQELGLKTWKIPSGEITNLPYLRKIGSLQGSVILSTGMATLGEIENSIDVLEKAGTVRGNISVLHCTTEYPAPIEEVNLRAIQTIRNAFGVRVGYSDHTRGIEIPIAAVALGASIIEKHFTLSRSMEGPDHKASLEPQELKTMIKAIRNVESALGDGIKRPSPSEMKNKDVARKSIVAARFIRKGEILDALSLTVKRPGNGINPMLWDNILGKRAVKDFEEDEVITW